MSRQRVYVLQSIFVVSDSFFHSDFLLSVVFLFLLFIFHISNDDEVSLVAEHTLIHVSETHVILLRWNIKFYLANFVIEFVYIYI